MQRYIRIDQTVNSKSLKVDKLLCEKINKEMLVNPIENS